MGINGEKEKEKRNFAIRHTPAFFNSLKQSGTADIFAGMKKIPTDVLRKLRSDFAPFCRKHGVRSLAVFGSLARGTARSDSDLDLLVDPAQETTIPEILEMAGEAEEIAGRPVD